MCPQVAAGEGSKLAPAARAGALGALKKAFGRPLPEGEVLLLHLCAWPGWRPRLQHTKFRQNALALRETVKRCDSNTKQHLLMLGTSSIKCLPTMPSQH